MKKIFILGASGSIGENALSVIDSNKEKFELIGISVNSNVEKANQIIKKYSPKYIYIFEKLAKDNLLKTENAVIFEDEKGGEGKVHEECMKNYQLKKAPRCYKCKKPIVAGGLFSGSYYSIEGKGKIHKECYVN